MKEIKQKGMIERGVLERIVLVCVMREGLMEEVTLS